jgi:hypothetical protein
MSRSTRYLDPGRLDDVILLIQILAFDPRGQISESRITTEFTEPATKGVTSWAKVANEHPEFFRVSGDTNNKAIALVVRFLQHGEQHPLNEDFVRTLISTAIDLHDRQQRRQDRHAAYLPLITALIAGVFTLAATLLATILGRK